MVRLELASGTIEYVNCGHNNPYLFHCSLEKNAARKLKFSGPILGIDANARYEKHNSIIKPGEFLVIFSDGVVEAQNTRGDLYSDETLLVHSVEAYYRVLEQFHENKELNIAQEIEGYIRKHVDNFRSGAVVNDDTTMLVLTRL